MGVTGRRKGDLLRWTENDSEMKVGEDIEKKDCIGCGPFFFCLPANLIKMAKRLLMLQR